ncbi:MAG: signal peptidase I [Fusobacteriaceae bacterium]
MEKSKLIINGIFYIFLTSFFIYIFIKEKELVKKIAIKKDIFSDYIINKLGIKKDKIKYVIKKIIHYTETIGTALILVLVIQKFYLGNFLVPTGSMIPTIVPKDRLFGNMVIYKFFKPKREDIIVFKEPIQNKVLYTKRLMGLPGEKVEIKNGGLYINDTLIQERGYADLGEIKGVSWQIPKKGDKVVIVPIEKYDVLFKEKNIDVEKVQEYLLENPGAVGEILPQIEFQLNGVKTGMLLDLIDKKEVLNKLISGEKVEIILEEDYYMALGDNTEGSYDSRMWGFVAENRLKGKAFVRFWPLNRIGLLK